SSAWSPSSCSGANADAAPRSPLRRHPRRRLLPGLLDLGRGDAPRPSARRLVDRPDLLRRRRHRLGPAPHPPAPLGRTRAEQPDEGATLNSRTAGEVSLTGRFSLLIALSKWSERQISNPRLP